MGQTQIQAMSPPELVDSYPLKQRVTVRQKTPHAAALTQDDGVLQMSTAAQPLFKWSTTLCIIRKRRTRLLLAHQRVHFVACAHRLLRAVLRNAPCA